MFQNLLKKIASELNNLRIPYMVIGGQAVLLYGEPRLTRDIDITLGVGTGGLEDIKGAVKRLALRILVKDAEGFVQKTMVLPVMDDETGIRADFIFSFSPYERQAIKRAIGVKFADATVMFASLEDVVIHKVIAGRPRDIEDVRSILLKNPGYGKKYIREWLSEFDKSLHEDLSGAFEKIVEETS